MGRGVRANRWNGESAFGGIGVLFYLYWWLIVVKKEVMSKSTHSVLSPCVTPVKVTACSGDVVICFHAGQTNFAMPQTRTRCQCCLKLDTVSCCSRH